MQRWYSYYSKIASNRLNLIREIYKAFNEADGRFGFSTLVVTNYQPNDETGIILGGSNFVRPMSVDILNNNTSNQIGVLKIEVFKKIKGGNNSK